MDHNYGIKYQQILMNLSKCTTYENGSPQVRSTDCSHVTACDVRSDSREVFRRGIEWDDVYVVKAGVEALETIPLKGICCSKVGRPTVFVSTCTRGSSDFFSSGTLTMDHFRLRGLLGLAAGALVIGESTDLGRARRSLTLSARDKGGRETKADAQDADGDEGTNVDIDVDSGKACKTGRKEAFDLVGDVSGDEDSTDVSSRSEFDEESERDIRGLVGV